MSELLLLPDLAFDVIWQELNFEDRLTFRVANKYCCSIANNYFFRNLIISDADPRRIELLSKYGKLVRTVSISEVKVSFEEMTRYCPNLTKLGLKRVELGPQEVANYHPSRLRNLSLTVDGRFSSEKDIPLWFPSLSFFSSLSILHLYEVCPLTAQHIFYSLPKLTEFNYTSNGPIVPKAWKSVYLLKLQTNFPLSFKQDFINRNLRTLSVKNYFKLNVDQDLIYLKPENFPRLTKIGLELYDGTLGDWHTGFWPDVTHLYINYKNTKVSHLEGLPLSFPNLRHLHCHKLLRSPTIPLASCLFEFKYLTHLSLDLSRCETDLEVLESLPVIESVRTLGFHFRVLNHGLLELLASRFPLVRCFEFIGAVHPDHDLTYQVAEYLNSYHHPPSSSVSSLYFSRFPWSELIVPDFNELLIEIIRLCPSLHTVYHRFVISDIPPEEAQQQLQYTHPQLNILHLSSRQAF